jgi:8-oxo-dGTP pyrophosphatase MutT (NUDIX family)
MRVETGSVTLADRLGARFAATGHLPAPFGGDDFQEMTGDPTPAAVLAAVVDRPEPTLLLTRRNELMRKHPGQVAFPGGRADPGDDGPIDTALREAEEEIALPRDAVSIVGIDTPYRTITGFSIIPVLAVIPPDLPLIAREMEVAAIFEVPLRFLFDPINQIRRELQLGGVQRRYYEMLWEEHRIWGATAAMIVNLARRIGDG